MSRSAGDGVDLETQRAVALKAYTALTGGTDWHVRWASDDDRIDRNGMGAPDYESAIAARRSQHGASLGHR